MVLSGWLEAMMPSVAAWKSARVRTGELSAMTFGTILMPLWLADS